jgi:2-methylisocitrate lyase-like PEP mutase family enzyme
LDGERLSLLVIVTPERRVNAPVELERPTSRLKALLASKRAAILPGTPNALFGRVIEDLGFEAVYVTGAGIANMSLGVPDIGLVTLSELAENCGDLRCRHGPSACRC